MEKFPTKDPSELFPLTFDFSDALSGEAINSATVAIEVYSGTDATPANVLSGAATVSGDRVRQNVTGGVDGVEYLIRCTITTAAAMKYTLGRILPVQKAGL